MAEKAPEPKKATKKNPKAKSASAEDGSTKDAATKKSRRKLLVGLAIAVATALAGALVTAIATPVFDHLADRFIEPSIEQAADGPFDATDPFDVVVVNSTLADVALPDPLDDPALYGPLMAGEYDQSGFADFTDALGARPVRQLFIKVIFTARAGHDVSIVDMRPIILTVEPVLTGTFIQKPHAQGGDDVALTIDLDAPADGFATNTGETYFQTATTALKPDEDQPFDLLFNATRSAYRWLLKVEFKGPDDQVSAVLIDQDGTLFTEDADLTTANPFTITGKADGYTLRYESNYYNSGPGYSIVP